MFIYDIETCDVESTSVILSTAILYVDEKKDYTAQELYENTLFVKFKAREQIDLYKRTISKDTIVWWNKQCDLAKNMSFFPKKSDLSTLEGIACLKKYINEHTNNIKNELVWVRGSVDQIGMDSLCKRAQLENLFHYSNYRDVRTAIDLLYETSVRGYCLIDTEKLSNWDENIIIKHDPIWDVVYDALMLLYGK